MTIRALAFAACLALTGCAAAEQFSRHLALETPNFLEPEAAATVSNSTGAHPALGPWKRPQNVKRIETAKVHHQNRHVGSEKPESELPLDAASREVLFRKFLEWRERRSSAP
jgi:hypothetical protein